MYLEFQNCRTAVSEPCTTQDESRTAVEERPFKGRVGRTEVKPGFSPSGRLQGSTRHCRPAFTVTEGCS